MSKINEVACLINELISPINYKVKTVIREDLTLAPSSTNYTTVNIETISSNRMILFSGAEFMNISTTPYIIESRIYISNSGQDNPPYKKISYLDKYLVIQRFSGFGATVRYNRNALGFYTPYKYIAVYCKKGDRLKMDLANNTAATTFTFDYVVFYGYLEQ